MAMAMAEEKASSWSVEVREWTQDDGDISRGGAAALGLCCCCCCFFVAAASPAGQRRVVVHRVAQGAPAAAFVLAHRTCTVVVHGAADTFAALSDQQQALPFEEEEEEEEGGKDEQEQEERKLQTTMRTRKEAEMWLWEWANAGRLRDAQLLDALLALAVRGSRPALRSLEAAAAEHADPASHAAHLLLSSSSSAPPPPPLLHLQHRPTALTSSAGESSAAIYAATVVDVFAQMSTKAAALMGRCRDELLPGAVERFGLLTDIVQAKAAIALRAITHAGMAVDPAALAQMTDRTAAEVAEHVAAIVAMPGFDAVFQRSRDGKLVQPPGSSRPVVDKAALAMLLQKAADESAAAQPAAETREEAKGVGAEPETASETLAWGEQQQKQHGTELRARPRRRSHPFAKRWFALEHAAHLHQFLLSVSTAMKPMPDHPELCEVHPRYDVLTRNGRTRCNSPNIQGTPTAPGFREVFVAPPGHVLLTLDFCFIELCTLAAICESRYGFSVLGEVIRQGVDPHGFTAAVIKGMALDEFMALKSSENAQEREQFQQWRQKAKAINFGIPAGWSPRALMDYALSSFGVEMTIEEAVDLRGRLVRQVSDVYPEIGLYLHEDSMDLVARNVGATPNDTWRALWKHKRTRRVVAAIRSVIKGNVRHQQGKDDATAATTAERLPGFVQDVWRGLKELSEGNAELRKLVDDAEAAVPQSLPAHASKDNSADPHERLHAALFGADCTTLTGRVRSGVSFTKARNTPFSGLAADGAKLALFNLVHSGFRVVAFVHDEIVVELAETPNISEQATLVESIAIRSMQELTGSVPISCKCALSRRWSKEPARRIDPATGALLVHENL